MGARLRCTRWVLTRERVHERVLNALDIENPGNSLSDSVKLHCRRRERETNTGNVM